MTILGSKLPEPYFTLVVDSRMGFRRLRRCTVCRYISTTVEVPLASRTEPSPADCCPNHSRTKSVVVNQVSPTAAIKNNQIGQGLLKCISLGGVYRRRACGLNYVFRRDKNNNYFGRPAHQIQCKGKRGEPMRWTTVELDSTGVVTRDVSICSNCGAQTRSYRGTKERFESWRLETIS